MNNAVGTKYEATRDLDIAVIAKMVRADIKAAIADGSLPVGLKCSVAIERFAGGKSLDVTVTAFPGQIETDEAVRYYASRDWTADRPREIHTPAAKAAIAKLEEIRNAYNFDHSDIQSDYFHVRFYGDSTFSHEVVEASRSATIARKAAETRATAEAAQADLVVAEDRCAAAQARLAEAEARVAAVLVKVERARIERDTARAELAIVVGCFAGNA